MTNIMTIIMTITIIQKSTNYDKNMIMIIMTDIITIIMTTKIKTNMTIA